MLFLPLSPFLALSIPGSTYQVLRTSYYVRVAGISVLLYRSYKALFELGSRRSGNLLPVAQRGQKHYHMASLAGRKTQEPPLTQPKNSENVFCYRCHNRARDNSDRPRSGPE